MRKPKILTRLHIGEVSSVGHAANEGAKILLMKRHDDNSVIIDESTAELAEYVVSILADKNINKTAAMTRLFEDFGDYLKSNITKAAEPMVCAACWERGRETRVTCRTFVPTC
jgi:hypothetical protein